MEYHISTIDLLLVLIYLFIGILSIIRFRKLEYKQMIVMGLLLRIGLMFCDLMKLFPIPNLGADSEVFHSIAFSNYLGNGYGRLTNYTDFLTLLYNISGGSRVFGQLVNITFGMGVIVYGQKAIQLVIDNKRLLFWSTLILCFSPNLIIFSAGLLTIVR